MLKGIHISLDVYWSNTHIRIKWLPHSQWILISYRFRAAHALWTHKTILTLKSFYAIVNVLWRLNVPCEKKTFAETKTFSEHTFSVKNIGRKPAYQYVSVYFVESFIVFFFT